MVDGLELTKLRSVDLEDPTVGAEPWLLTPVEVARTLRISRSKVYELLAAGPRGLPSIAIGRSRRIRASDLRDWLERQAAA